MDMDELLRRIETAYEKAVEQRDDDLRAAKSSAGALGDASLNLAHTVSAAGYDAVARTLAVILGKEFSPSTETGTDRSV